MSLLDRFADFVVQQISTTKKVPKSEPIETFQGRWGFHPYPYETHLKLKRLHRWVFESYKKHCDLSRWANKTVKRLPKEPETDINFTVTPEHNIASWKCYRMLQYGKNKETGETEGEYIEKGIIHPVNNKTLTITPDASKVVYSFKVSRIPAETADEVKNPDMTKEEIDELYDKIFSKSSN